MTISEVAKKYSITIDTLRYYEKIGLIPPVPRNSSKRRNYDEESCNWVELMCCLRKAGVEIDALIKYVELFQKGDETVDERKQLLKDQREKLAEKMSNIQNSLQRLDKKIERYESGLMIKEKELQRMRFKKKNV